MTPRLSRANALPETALVISLVLLLLYSATQMAIASYTQMTADGAAFVSARSTVQHYTVANALQGPVQTFAKAVASSVFDRVKTTDVTVSNPTSSTFETTVVKQVAGFNIPGSPAHFNVTGRDIEAQGPLQIGNGVLGLSNLPKLPNSTTNCPTVFGLSGQLTGGATNFAQQVANQLATGQGQLASASTALGYVDNLLSPLNSILGTTGGGPGSPLGTAIANAIAPAVTSALGVLSPLLSQVTNLLTSNNSILDSAVLGGIQDVVNKALSGATIGPNDLALAVTTHLSTAIQTILGPVISGLLGPLVNTIASNLATALTATLNPLYTPLSQLSGDHGAIQTLLGGSCS